VEKIMFKTTFRISKMDCPSQEQMIRTKLEEMAGIQKLNFDIPGRTLEIFHRDSYESYFTALESLRFDTKLISSEAIASVDMEEDHRLQRRVLWQVLAINFFFFALEIISGLVAGSMGLVADSLDMLADSIVYGFSLCAVGGTVARKKNIAGAAGYFQMVLAVLGFAEVVRRFLGHEVVPDFHAMIVISFLALAGNAACLYLLQKSKSQEAHMQASMIFTSTDVIVNLGVIAAGILVYLTGSKIPDLIVGMFVFILVGRGAYRILQLSR
jgi:Co/Zn/Cd efflux system component